MVHPIAGFYGADNDLRQPRRTIARALGPLGFLAWR
jgi:hypothetical protein